MSGENKNHAMKWQGGKIVSEPQRVNNWGNASAVATNVSLETAIKMANGTDAFIYSEIVGGSNKPRLAD